ncbi:MAG: hypothetical protein ACLTQI_05840 [Slackia sp.]
MPICVPIRDMKDTAAFAETVHAAQAPVIVTKNGKETLVSMSPEVYEGLHSSRKGTALTSSTKAYPISNPDAQGR